MDAKDSCDVLEYNTGTKNVLGITLDMDEIDDELHIHENAFRRMPNLLFLEIHTNKWDQKNEVRWHLPEGFNYLPQKLRILRMDGYPMRYMPSNFHAENLVKLHMPGSKLKRLWEGVHFLRALKDINLDGSRNLKEIPNLSMATNLEKLNLVDCSSLVELPSSIQYLNKLENLDMSGCINLEILPTGINLQSLSWLDLKGCSRIKIFPDISTNISGLFLYETAIEEFPSNLRLDNLRGFGMSTMKSDQKLWGRVQPLTPLMAILPHSLEHLCLSDIPSLVEIPSSIQNFKKLGQLVIIDCINLETLPTGINLQHLRSLDLSGCSRLKTFPNISTNIYHLNLNQTEIDEVPWWIENFTNLYCICMEKCNNLSRVSLNIYKLKHLQADFSDCRSLTEASWNGSSSEVAMVTDNMHSKFPVLDEAFYYDQNRYDDLKVRFSFKFVNLDPEALFRQRLIFNAMVLSGEEVPSYFTHRTTEISLTNIPLLQSSLFQQFFKFKACAMVMFDSVCKTWGYRVCIRVNCRFKDRFGNSFDTFGQPHWFGADAVKETYHLFILDCGVPLNKDNAPLAHLNYDHVDMQIQIRSQYYRNFHTFKLKEWGIRLLGECSSPENGLPHVCEADEDSLVSKTEHSQECAETVMKRKRETSEKKRKRKRKTGSDFRYEDSLVNKTKHSEKCVEMKRKRETSEKKRKRKRETESDFRLREGPLMKPLLLPASDTKEENKMSL